MKYHKEHEMIAGYYEELDAANFPLSVIKGLDQIIQSIGYDRKRVERTLLRESVTPEQALARCSTSALMEISANGSRDVATHDCNILRFNNVNFDFLGTRIAELFSSQISSYGISGRIWYPPGGYMGWHTNNDNRGCKLYCTFAREGQKSFFRYRNPETGHIITTWDKEGWNFRIFKVTEHLLWHCVYSETDRFSVGYTLFPK